MTFNAGSDQGFMAGTVVHSKQGLIPIQHIQVGDLVWSKADTGEGERALKRVSRTFKSATKQAIIAIEFFNDYRDELILSTDDHPFYADDCWTPAKALNSDGGWNGEGNVLETIKEGKFVIAWVGLTTSESLIKDVFFTVNVENKYSPVSYVLDSREDGTPKILYCDQCLLSTHAPKLPHKMLPLQPMKEVSAAESQTYMDVVYRADESIFDNRNLPPYMATVYNLEIEDYHSYFVGESGILVQDACGESGFLMTN